MKHYTRSDTLWLVAGAILALGVLVACAATPPTEPPAVPSPTSGVPKSPLPTDQPAATPATPTSSAPAAGATPGSGLEGQIVASVRADLASELNISPDEVLARSVEAVEWPDGSLGCPKPGAMYIQVITPGYRILLEAQGRIYEYHTDRASGRVLCDR